MAEPWSAIATEPWWCNYDGQLYRVVYNGKNYFVITPKNHGRTLKVSFSPEFSERSLESLYYV